MKPTNEDIQHQYGIDQSDKPSQPHKGGPVYRNNYGTANYMGNMAQQMNWHQPAQQYAMNQHVQNVPEYGGSTQPFASQEYGSNTQSFVQAQEYGSNTQPFAQAEVNQSSQEAVKEQCQKMKDHHVEIKMANGQSIDGILTEVRDDGIIVLVGEDVYQEDSRQFGWRYRRYRRRFFPYGGFFSLGFFPYFFPPVFFY